MNLFKVSFSASCLTDSVIKKMTGMWNDNSNMSNFEIRQKWDSIIEGHNPYEFIRRLRQTARTSAAKLRRFNAVDDPDYAEIFDISVADTIKALERVYLVN